MVQTLRNVCRFYVDGFRSMTWGRVLWVIILVKLLLMFLVLRVFFFPDYLDEVSNGEDKEEYVSNELILRSFPR